jgi:hypothetical protein
MESSTKALEITYLRTTPLKPNPRNPGKAIFLVRSRAGLHRYSKQGHRTSLAGYFRLPIFHARPSRLLTIYEQFADPLPQISKPALSLFRFSKGKYLFFVRLSVNTVLSRVDSSRQTPPPCSSAIRRARVSPRPVPLGFPSVTNGSNKVLRTEAGMPGPLSRIVT